MLIEGRSHHAGNSLDRIIVLPPIGEEAFTFIDHTLRTAHFQTQLGYSPRVMREILPIVTAYYLMSKANNELGSFGGVGVARACVIAAMRMYPSIVDEITIEQHHNRPLDARDSHDIAIWVGQQLAELENARLDEVTMLRRVKEKIEIIRDIKDFASKR